MMRAILRRAQRALTRRRTTSPAYTRTITGPHRTRPGPGALPDLPPEHQPGAPDEHEQHIRAELRRITGEEAARNGPDL